MRDILEKLRTGEISVEEAEKQIRLLAIEEVENSAKIDLGRYQRRGFPEIILAEGKTLHTISEIVSTVLRKSNLVFVSRLSEAEAAQLTEKFRDNYELTYHRNARMLVLKSKGFASPRIESRIGILTAGTSDIPVAEEAEVVLSELGCDVLKAVDVGIAGLHRLIQPLKEMLTAEVDLLIVVAGREGALPGVVASLVDVPVIAVPTSIGYGHGGRGEAALASMLQACSLGITVVNIDAGLAAGIAAFTIARRIEKGRTTNKNLIEGTNRNAK